MKPLLKVGKRYIPWHNIIRIQENPDKVLVICQAGEKTVHERVEGDEGDALLRWLDEHSVDPRELLASEPAYSESG